MYFWGKLHIHLSVESDPRELLSYETSMQNELMQISITGQVWLSLHETSIMKV